MRRRQVLTLLGGAATWPLAAHAQQQAVPVIGFLNGGQRRAFEDRLVGLHRGLSDEGFVEGQNLAIDYRWADGQLARLTDFAADLARKQVNAIAATGNTPSVLEAKKATSVIPIVFIAGIDPVKAGLVASLNKPGGNITGVSTTNNAELGAKRLQVLRDLVPGLTRVAILVNPASAAGEEEAAELHRAAAIVSIDVIVVKAAVAAEFERAFAAIAEQNAQALVVSADPFFNSERGRLIRLAGRNRIPAIYSERVFCAEGGLVSYGPSLAEGYRQVGIYLGRILKGERPADLPVVQPTKFDLVINSNTAKELGLSLHPMLLALADEVIE